MTKRHNAGTNTPKKLQYGFQQTFKLAQSNRLQLGYENKVSFFYLGVKLSHFNFKFVSMQE